MPGKTTAKHYAIYIRVSTDQQIKPEGSLQSQEFRVIEYLRYKLGTSEFNYKIYKDEGLTGRNTNRPEYLRMLAEIKADKVIAIVATELSRLSRSIIDLNSLLAICQSHNTTFIVIREGFDTSTAQGKLLFNIFGSLAQYESEQISERVRANCISRAKRGLYIGSKTFGYRSKPGSPGGIEIVDDEAIVVKMIFDLYIETGAYVPIAKYLNERGYTHYGKPWYKSSIYNVLTNEVYISRRTFDDEIITTQWEPILSKATWDKAQKILAENYTQRSNTVAENKHTFYFAGLIYCQYCQKLLVSSSGTSKSGKEYYYYRHESKAHTCNLPKYIGAEQIEQDLFCKIIETIADKNFIDKIAERVKLQYSDELNVWQDKITVVKRNLASVDAQISAIIARIGLFDENQIKKLIKPQLDQLLEGKNKLTQELDTCQQNFDEMEANIPNTALITQIISEIENIYQELSDQKKKAVINLLVNRVELTNDTAICHINRLDETKKDVRQIPDYLPRQVSQRTSFTITIMQNFGKMVK